jgi:hypothetical protein
MTLFPTEATAVLEFKSRLAAGAGRFINNLSSLTDDQLYSYLIAGEREASKELRVFFEPTTIIPDDALQPEVDALDGSVAGFHGYIAGKTLTVTTVESGTIAVHQTIVAAGILPGTVITAQVSGATGGTGVYSVSIAQTIATSSVTVAMTAAINWFQESGYDYDPDFFSGDKWGYLVTKQKPIISVESIKFSYPSPANTVFAIPNEWVRLDRKYGHIRLVPAAASFQAPLSAFIMQAIGGGRTIPFMIQIRYTAGLKNPTADYPDLIDLIYKMATFRMLFGAFIPGSSSISADGLSQSQTIAYADWKKEIDAKLKSLRSAIHGIRMSCV